MIWFSIILIVISLSILYVLASRRYKFWSNAGVRCFNEPTLRGAFRGTFFTNTDDTYNFAPGEPYIGVLKLTAPSVIIRDPDLLRLVLSKDFAHFHDRGMPHNEKRDPLSIHLFNVEGRRWNIIRAKLTPTFSSGKLRGMFPLIKYSIDQMSSVVETYANPPQVVDMSGLISKCTTDVILNCAFGVQGNALKDPDDEFPKMIKRYFKFSPLHRIGYIVLTMFPWLESILPLSKNQQTINDFFINTFTTTVKERERSGLKRNDFLDILIEIRRNGYLTGGRKNEDSLDTSIEFTYNLMAAQAFAFVFAGSETSASTSSFAIVEIANNPLVQQRLQEEVDESINRHGGLTYEGVNEMAYLNQVVSETLRRYPSLSKLIRKVTKPYLMPDGKVTLPVGMRVHIPTEKIHHDPRYYPDPMRFDPDRFSPQAELSRHKYVYFPFGEGPRKCIGMRFGMLEVKLTLASLISEFEFRPKPGIPYPPKISKASGVTSLAHGAPLFVMKRTNKT